jgi:SAM-dependent methyltransferase
MSETEPLWFADDSFWEVSYPFMFGDDKLGAANEETQRIVELSGVRAGSVVDWGCGPGRHSVALALVGFAVTGVDRTPFLLDHAKRRAAESNVEIEWVLTDMRDFVRPASFDLALSIFTSFGYFEEHADNMRVLDNARESLRPGGKLVIDLMGKELLVRLFEPTGSTHLAGVGTVFQRRRLVEGFTKIEVEWIFVPDGAGPVRRWRMRHWLYSARELELMLTEVGFAAIQLAGDFDGRPYEPAAKRLIAVAHCA